MAQPPPALIEFLRGYDPGIQSLALDLRKVVHEEMAPCHEYIFEMRSKVMLLYGATARVIEDGICNIAVFRRHVLLGFARGAELDDAAGVLQGTGKAMRHIRLKALSDLEQPHVREFLRRARRHAGLTRKGHRTSLTVTTRVKKKSPARRPARPQTFW